MDCCSRVAHRPGGRDAVYAEVVWTPADFTAAAVLLFGSLGLYEWLARRAPGIGRRIGIAVLVLAAVALVWVDAAVGIVGDEPHPAFLLVAFAGVGMAVVLARRKTRA